jgi:hypothetical protein
MLVRIRFYFPEIVFGVLLAVAIFALGMVFESSRPSHQRQQHAASEQKPPDKAAEHQHETQSLWIPTDSVGLYTLVLAVFTGLLVAVSGFQGYFLLRSDRTARISAEAAKKSADHIPRVERAYIAAGGPLSKKKGNFHKCFEIDVANYGKTPAYLNGFTAGFSDKKGLGSPPPYLADDFVRTAFDDVIAPGQTKKAIARIDACPLNGTYVFGRVWYYDVLGEEEHFFSFVLSVSDHQTHSDVSREGVHPEYTRWT